MDSSKTQICLVTATVGKTLNDGYPVPFMCSCYKINSYFLSFLLSLTMSCHLLCHLAEKDLYYYVFVQHLSQLKVYREGGALPPGVCLDCLGINWTKNAD